MLACQSDATTKFEEAVYRAAILEPELLDESTCHPDDHARTEIGVPSGSIGTNGRSISLSSGGMRRKNPGQRIISLRRQGN